MNDFYNADNNDNVIDNGRTTRGGGNGVNIITFLDTRAAGYPFYLPAHISNTTGKEIQQQANFAIYQNINGKKMVFQITAWGNMADVIAKGVTTGKQLQLICIANAYRGRVWLPVPDGAQPQFVTLPDGQPLMIDKVGFTINDLVFGKDSNKTIQEEIERGFRPVGWNNPASPDYQAWLNQCRINNALKFNPNMQWFGYAKVKPVNGVMIDPYAKRNQRFNDGQQQPPQQNEQQSPQQNSWSAQQNQQNGWNTQQNQQGGWGTQQQPKNNQNGWGTQQQGQAQTHNQQSGGNPAYVNGAYVGQTIPNNQNGGFHGSTASNVVM